MNRRANTRLSRFSYVLGLIALTVLTGLAITATSTDAAGVRFGFVESVASWFGGGASANVGAEPQPTPGEEAPTVTGDLFFSEYIEGSSSNKAIEIYNGTGAPVNLGAGNYILELYSNGSLTVSSTKIINTTIANGDVYVLAHSSAVAAITSQADETLGGGVIDFNGDDAIVLKKGGAAGQIVDVIGQIGVDPGTEWGTGLTSTADNTLVRKSTVCAGDTNGTNAFVPATEWDGFATDTSTNLGSHTAPCASYSISYDGNLNTGGTAPVDASSPYPPGSTVGVLGAGTLVKTGFEFGGWNTAANGSGTQYNPGQAFAISGNTTLYAQWITPLCSGLDTTFDTDGKVTTTIGGSDSAYNMAVQPDGKIVVVGTSSPFGSAPAVARYNTNGSLDTSFDTDGKLNLPGGIGVDVALQTDGKIVVGGYAYNGSNYDFLLYRLNTNGSLDTSFSGDGRVDSNLGGTDHDYVMSIAVQADGKIVAAGYIDSATDSPVVARYNTDGSLDTTFDTDGSTAISFGVGSRFYSMALQPDGKIVGAGVAYTGVADFAAARLNANGSLDTSFSSDGKVTTAFFSNTDEAYSVAYQPDGKLVLAGRAYNNTSQYDFALLRYNTDGSLDTSFSGDGKLTTAVGNSSDYAGQVKIQPNGKIITAGATNNGSNNDFAIARYNSDGSLDTSFDTDGIMTVAFTGSSDDNGNTLAIQPDGRIVAAGSSGTQFALIRTGTTTCPEITVTGNGGGAINDGDTGTSPTNGTDLGSALVAGGTVDRTFVITNDGTAVLSLDASIGISGTHSSDFTVFSDSGETTLAPAATRTFILRFDPSASGLRTAAVSFGNNDTDENPFNFAIQGTGLVPPTTQASNITFSSAAVNGVTVNWTNGDGAKRIVKINTSNSFTDPVNGTDPVANANWANAGEQVIYNGTGSSVAVFTLPSSTVYYLRVYEANDSGSSIVYNTSTATNNPNATAPEIIVTHPTVTEQPSGSTIDYGSLALGQSLGKDFIIRNVGSSNLVVSAVGVGGGNASDFVVTTSGSVPFTRTPGQGQTFTITFTPPLVTGAGLRSTTLSISNTDSDENPYLLTLQGTGIPAPTVTAVNPTSGSVIGGNSVTITGTGFTGVTGVTFGGAACTSVNFVSDTEINCTAPAHAAGAVSVVVTTPSGTNAANTLYTYINTCTAGTYFNGSACVAADPGFYVPTSGQTSQTQCAAGTFQPDPGSVSCNQATAGNYVPAPQATAQIACAVGTYQPGAGAQACLQADAGSFVAIEGSASQSPCLAGTYQPNPGQSACMNADAGSFVAGSGSTSQTACAAGSYQPNQGASSCILADAGTFISGTGSTTAGTPCALGTYQPSTGQSACINADPGNIVNSLGATAQTQCVAGSYQPNPGQSACILADPGFFVANPGATMQDPCPPGTTSGAGATVCTAIPETHAEVATGSLTVTDINGGTSNDNLNVSCNTGNLIINDPGNPISAGAGVTVIDANTVSVPIATIFGQVIFDTLAGNDSLTVNLNGCVVLPSGGIQFAGGAGTSDSLVLQGTTTTVDYGFFAADAGTVFTLPGIIGYNGVEGLTDSIVAETRTFNLPAGPSGITLGDDGTSGNGLSRISGSTIPTVTFANPTTGLTINRGNAADQLAVTGVPDLTCTQTFGTETDPLNVINVSAPVVVSGSVNFAATTVTTTTSSSISTTGGLYVYTTGTLSLMEGVIAGGGAFTVDGGGTVVVAGTNTFTGGVVILGGSVVSVSADLNLGAAPSVYVPGYVQIVESTLLVTSSFTIDPERGIFVGETSGLSYGTVSVMPGVVFVVGSVFDDNGTSTSGIYVTGGGTFVVTAVNLYSGSTVIVDSTVQVSSDVNLGTAPLVFTAGHLVIDGGTLFATSTFTVDPNRGIFVGDSVLVGTGSFWVESSVVLTVASVIDDNGTGDDGVVKVGPGTLKLDGANAYEGPTEVDQGTLNVVGSTTSDTEANAGSTIAGTGDVNGTLTTSSANVLPGTSPGILSTDSVTFDNGSTFGVEIGGATPGNAATNHDQLNVTGTVALGGATLSLNQFNAFVPTNGQTFVIINNDSNDAVTGTFNGLAQGGSLSNFLGSGLTAVISYTGGSGNDVVLTAFAPPTVTSVNPTSGPTAGGNSVTITGTNFTGASGVAFGGAACPITSNNGTEIVCTAPAHAAGAVSVDVTTPGGTNAPNTLYTYEAETTVTVSAGNLLIEDTNGGNSNDDITIACSGANITITDSGTGLNETVPIASVTGSITVNTLGGNDTLTVNLSGCGFIPAGGLFFNGGAAGDDALNISGYSGGTTTYNYLNANDGDIVMAGGTRTGTITYTGLEPIVNSGTPTDVTFNLPGGPSVATLADIGGGNSRLSSSPITFEQTDFVNPTGSVTINPGNQADGLAVNALATNYPSLTIGSAGNEFASILFGGAVTFGSGKNLSGFATGMIVFTGGTSDVATSGAGTIGLTTASNILMLNGSSLQTADGALTLNANQQLTPTGGAFIGVDINSASVRATGTGVVTVNGKGGTTGGQQHGVRLTGVGSLIKGGNAAGITTSVTGNGGAGTGASNFGVFITTGGSVTSFGGNVSVTGTGGAGTGGDHHGVRLFTNGTINAELAGTVTVLGTGGTAAAGGCFGVDVRSPGSAIGSSGGSVSVTGQGGACAQNTGVNVTGGATAVITSGGGPVTVTGTGGNGGSNSDGISMYRSAQITATGTGNVIVEGTGGNGSDSEGVQLLGDASAPAINSSGGTITVTGTSTTSIGILLGGAPGNNCGAGCSIASGSNADVTLISDSMALATGQTTSVSAGTGSVTLRQKTNSVGIDLGSATDPAVGPLSLTDAEVDRIAAGTLNIGNANSGTINVSGSIDVSDSPQIPTVNLVTAANVLAPNAVGTDLIAFNLNVTGPSGIGAVGVPLDIDTALLTTNSSGLNGAQYLREFLTTTIGPNDLNAGSQAVWLIGGTFLTTSTGSILSDVNLNGSGAVLGGNGAVSLAKATTVLGGLGTIAPGDSPGILTTGSTFFTPGATFAAEIGGNTAGTGAGFHDQLNATGVVDLNGATLNLSAFGGFTPTAGQTFVIVNNNGNGTATEDTINQFGGIGEGATIAPFLVPGMQATITYQGGSNSNDVILTAVLPPAIITLSDPNPIGFGNVTVGNTSPAQTYDVSGVNLTADIVVTAPTHFQVSLSPTSGFGPSVNIPFGSGTVTNVPVYIRFVPTAAGTFSDPITHTSGAATPQNKTALGTGVAAVCTAPPPDMVAWYKGDGNADDQLGVNNGTVQNGATFAGGKVGQAFSLDGTNDRVLFNNVSALQIQNFTIDAWIRRSSSTLTTTNPAVGFEAGTFVASGPGGYLLGIDQATNLLFLGDTNVNVNAPSLPIVDTEFHHVAVTKNGTQVVFYVDGVATSAVTYSQVFSFGSPFAIGARGDGDLKNAFFGTIDEVEIFNRALTSTEIANIYNASTAGKCPTPDIVVEEPVNTPLVDGVSTVNFGTQNVPVAGTPKTFTIRNNGSSTLNIASVVSDSTEFVVDITGMSPTVAPSGNTAFTVTFTPNALGPRSGNLDIDTDDPDEDPFDIAMTGTGGCIVDPIVTTNANAGAGSLRQAVIDACVGSTITFAGSVSSPISLSTGQITIDKNLTIDGPATALTVQNTQAAGPTSRVFLINSGIAATIQDLTISGGNVTTGNNGGGILTDGTLTINNAVISSNISTGTFGGGIYVNGGTTNLNSVTIHSNGTNNLGNGSGLAMGAGTFVNVDASVIRNNTNAVTGGGFYNNGGTLVITNSTIGGSAGQGNSAVLGGGFVVGTGSITTITGGSISSNAAIGRNATFQMESYGGGVYAPGGTLTITGVDIVSNSTTPFGANQSRGGFLYRNGQSAVTISKSRIFGNTATTSGGAIENAAPFPQGTVSAENNWWGCDGFPNTAGCDTVNSPGGNVTDSDPRVDLRLTRSADPIFVGGTSTLSADVRFNSNNVNIGTIPPLEDKTITFGAAGFGTVVPGTQLIATGITPGSLFTSNGTAGVNVASATLDNGVQTGLTVQKFDSTTSVTSNANPSVFGQSVTFTATVAPVSPGVATPTGTVTFFDGVTPICTTVALSGGSATCLTSTLAVGNHTITASYNGDASYNTSSGSMTGNPQVVTLANSSTTIDSDTPDPTVVGQPYAVGVTVAPIAPSTATPTGTVNVSDGTGGTCVVTLSGGTGSCNLTSTSAGSKTLSATYGGDAGFNGSSDTDTHAVNPAATTTTITNAATLASTPTVVGETYAVNWSVAVAGPGALGVALTGNVTVDAGGGNTCAAAVSAGTCNIVSTTAGLKNITATYAGDANYNGSTSSGAAHTVNPAATTTTITNAASLASTPTVVGQSYAVTWNVSVNSPGSLGAALTGNVTVDAGGGNTCVAAVAAGTCNIVSTTAGLKNITATYAGDSNYNGSTSAGAAHTVNPAATTTTITSDNPDPSVTGEVVTVNFTVVTNLPGAGTPPGSVVITVSGGAETCSGTVAAGTCNITLTSAGSRTLTATYAGDANFSGSSDTETHVVNGAATTTTTISDVPDPSVVGQVVPVTFSVIANPPGSGTPTGNVVVTVSGGSETCTGTVAAGTCNITFTTAGARTLTATYSGDANYLTSNDTEPHQVNQAATTTTITTDNPDPSLIGDPYTVTWTVTVNSPGAGTPTGTVTVSDGTDSCNAAVSAGSCVLTSNTGGAKTLTATYSGDANFATSNDTEPHQVDCVPNPVVTNNADNGAGSLRRAVLQACSTAGQNTITFNMGSVVSPITLTSGAVALTKNVNINGPGAHLLTVQNTLAGSRVFAHGGIITSVISGMTITGGGSSNGGSIFNSGTLTLSYVTVSNNSSSNGGGIRNANGGVLTLNNSTVSNNSTTSSNGGGIDNGFGGTVTLNNSTISNNSAANTGGGIQNGGTVTLNNSTLSNNSATGGGGIYNLGGALDLNSSIIANSSGGDCAGAGTVNASYSLVEEGLTCVNGTNSNNLTGDPMLGPLANNGGPTQTHALMPTSPAYDKGNAFGLTLDQRGAGFPRTINNPSIPPATGGDNTDIGAFEIQNTPPTIAAVATTRQAGSPVSNSTIANVTDAESGNGGVVVTVTTANPSNGVTISNIVNTAGVITADVVAACGATTATFTLTATDGGSLTATATLTVTVNPNTPPTVTYNSPQNVVFGQSGFTVPTATATDNGSITGYVLQSVVPPMTSAPTVNAANGTVTINAAAPVGAHVITVRSTDNCGSTTDSSFTLNINKAGSVTTITSDSPDPSVVGQPYNVVVSVAAAAPGAGTPTGTIVVSNGTTSCNITLPATNCSLTSTTAGVIGLSATYSGDSNFNGSADGEPHTVNAANTTTTITSDTPDPSLVSEPYTVSWSVVVNSPGVGTPTGTVTVNGGTGGGSCSAPVASGSCQLTPTTVGVKTVTATYSGDANFNGSTSTPITHTVNISITGTVRNGVTMAPVSGVTISLLQMPLGTVLGTATTNSLGGYAFVGQFTGPVAVQPTSGPPPYFDVTTRFYTLAGTNIVGADFLAYSSLTDIPRTLRLVNQYVVPGATGSMPVILNSQDNETFLSFSISYDINPFAQPPVFVCGPAAPGCTITQDTSVLGRVGVTVVPSGGTFLRGEGESPEAPGQKHVLTMNFSSLANGLPSTPIAFVNTPTPQVTRDAATNLLLTNYISGLVIFAQGREGDVANRNTGNGAFEAADVVQVRRFVAGLDTPVVTHNEFQRADSAPASVGGDGFLSATDVVQTRRYVAGLDPSRSAAGPGAANSGPIAPPEALREAGSREIRIGSSNASTGSRVTVPIEMRSNGDEMAVSFVLRYDAAKLGDAIVELADPSSGAILTANADEPGVIRVLVDSPSVFERWAKGTAFVNVSFDVNANSPTGDTGILIEDISISDDRANSLSVKPTNGKISIAGPNALSVEISGRVLIPGGAGLRNATVTLTDASGSTRSVTTGTFGYYRIDGIAPGQSYTLAVTSRRFLFDERKTGLLDSTKIIDFTAKYEQ